MINYDELYENWRKYSLMTHEMKLMSIAYSYSNTVFFLKDEGKSKKEIEAIMENIIFETVFGNEYMINKISKYIDLYVKRKKYIDYGYVC